MYRLSAFAFVLFGFSTIASVAGWWTSYRHPFSIRRNAIGYQRWEDNGVREGAARSLGAPSLGLRTDWLAIKGGRLGWSVATWLKLDPTVAAWRTPKTRWVLDRPAVSGSPWDFGVGTRPYGWKCLGFELLRAGTWFEHGQPTKWDSAIYVPFWALVVGFALLSFIFGRSALRGRFRAARRLAGRCIVCGYDLRSSSDRCPECGRSTTGEPMLPADSPASRLRVGLPVVTCVLGALALLWLWHDSGHQTHLCIRQRAGDTGRVETFRRGEHLRLLWHRRDEWGLENGRAFWRCVYSEMPARGGERLIRDLRKIFPERPSQSGSCDVEVGVTDFGWTCFGFELTRAGQPGGRGQLEYWDSTLQVPLWIPAGLLLILPVLTGCRAARRHGSRALFAPAIVLGERTERA